MRDFGDTLDHDEGKDVRLKIDPHHIFLLQFTVALIVLPAIARASPATASSYHRQWCIMSTTGSIPTLLVPAFYFLVIMNNNDDANNSPF